jgi:hypothetical protein
MDRENIKYSLQEDGAFVIASKDFEKVKRKMEGRASSGKDGAYIADPELRALFQEALSRNSINSQLTVIDGKEWLEWPKEDSRRAKYIFEELVLNRK